MKLYETSRSYAIRLSLRQFKRLDRAGYENVEKLMDRFPIKRIDWNGHFGSYFYFTCDDDKREFDKVAGQVMECLATIVGK